MASLTEHHGKVSDVQIVRYTWVLSLSLCVFVSVSLCLCVSVSLCLCLCVLRVVRCCGGGRGGGQRERLIEPSGC